MAQYDSITIEGEDKLRVNIDRCYQAVAKAAKHGIRTAGMRVIADAQRNMRTAGHGGLTLNNTGMLSQSGRVQDVPNSEDVEIGFFSREGGRGYAAAVEYGSRAHSAPLDPIRQWVKKKMRVAENRINTVAFFIHRKIRQKGTEAHPFFGPAVEKNKRQIVKSITDAISKVTNSDIK